MGFGNLGIWEILVIAVIILLFFGPRRLPEIARSMGRAIREFKRGVNEIQREFELAEDAEDSKREREAGSREKTGSIEPRGEPAGAVAAGSAAEEAATVDPGDGGASAGAEPSAAPRQGTPEGVASGRAPEDPSQSDLFGRDRA